MGNTAPDPTSALPISKPNPNLNPDQNDARPNKRCKTALGARGRNTEIEDANEAEVEDDEEDLYDEHDHDEDDYDQDQDDEDEDEDDKHNSTAATMLGRAPGGFGMGGMPGGNGKRPKSKRVKGSKACENCHKLKVRSLGPQSLVFVFFIHCYISL